eukprot:m.143028 g.143028  ORF g.143028 m.143028 type:complete len:106 (+) comp17684_c0_seq1:1149-1466(+)
MHPPPDGLEQNAHPLHELFVQHNVRHSSADETVGCFWSKLAQIEPFRERFPQDAGQSPRTSDAEITSTTTRKTSMLVSESISQVRMLSHWPISMDLDFRQVHGHV